MEDSERHAVITWRTLLETERTARELGARYVLFELDDRLGVGVGGVQPCRPLGRSRAVEDLPVTGCGVQAGPEDQRVAGGFRHSGPPLRIHGAVARDRVGQPCGAVAPMRVNESRHEHSSSGRRGGGSVAAESGQDDSGVTVSGDGALPAEFGTCC